MFSVAITPTCWFCFHLHRPWFKCSGVPVSLWPEANLSQQLSPRPFPFNLVWEWQNNSRGKVCVLQRLRLEYKQLFLWVPDASFSTSLWVHHLHQGCSNSCLLKYCQIICRNIHNLRSWTSLMFFRCSHSSLGDHKSSRWRLAEQLCKSDLSLWC